MHVPTPDPTSAASTTISRHHAGDGTTRAVFTRRWWLVLLAGIALTLLAIPLDAPISRAVLMPRVDATGSSRLTPKIGGDFKRELEFLQQFGAVSSLVIVGLVMLLLDRARARRVADMALSAAFVALACNALKLLIGRPRPKFDDPGTFLFPGGQYELSIQGENVLRHAWQIGSGISSDLWSMPSSHTAAGVALAVFLAGVYPKLRPLGIFLATIVGVARVLLGAHYLSDVVAGAILGYLVSTPITHARAGEQLLARIAGRREEWRLNS
jgi:membrane-associated phospholipid phosphatase